MQELTPANDLIAFASEAGATLFQRTPPNLIRWDLLESYAPQENPYFCGVAAVFSVLRAAGVRGPHLLSQHDVFTERAGQVRRKDQALNLVAGDYPGLAIEDARDILGQHFAKVQLHYGSALDAAALAQLVAARIAQPDTFLIATFDGDVLGLNSRGHFATVAAFNAASGRVLLLDPAGHKRGWFWVTLSALHQALLPVREVSEFKGLSRGLIEAQGMVTSHA